MYPACPKPPAIASCRLNTAHVAVVLEGDERELAVPGDRYLVRRVIAGRPGDGADHRAAGVAVLRLLAT